MLFLGGVDEAGRGPLAGPVVAAAVVLEHGSPVPGIRDSKKLSARQRERLNEVIRKSAVSWAIGIASVTEIDELNILHASMLAMRRAIEGLPEIPALLRVDGNRCPDMGPEFGGSLQALVGGDDICPAIGAASIVAKVERDAIMDELHREFPAYGFDRHRGYPTAQHRQALHEHGPAIVHRKSFRPVAEAAARRRNSPAYREPSA
ncbi:MAG: ribonuclease HII [Gammaproteobacteria bacterium]